ncbi:hypothetical protein BGZ63DRAFT_176077 [Mariannaea sp. PMI_226]|nr:hypothetical protein BGZ63DRAFT_176077 [Mariannaea sp. PMI_226]
MKNVVTRYTKRVDSFPTCPGVCGGVDTNLAHVVRASLQGTRLDGTGRPRCSSSATGNVLEYSTPAPDKTPILGIVTLFSRATSGLGRDDGLTRRFLGITETSKLNLSMRCLTSLPLISRKWRKNRINVR